MNNNEKSFTINCVGASGERWAGEFKVKTRLSHRDNLRRDGFRRDLLGSSASTASPEASATAELFSTIWAHLLNAPTWWNSMGNGLDLSDEEPVLEVFNQIVEVRKNEQAEMEKKAEEAKKLLQPK